MEATPFVEKIANKITRMGLNEPAILLLEAHKPLAFIGSQLLLVAQPTLNIFFSPKLTHNTANLLANPHQLEQLIVCLEQNRAAHKRSTKPALQNQRE